MDKGHNLPPIIKKKKIIAAEGHHGGAWKVAYADFVTAMMAFFLLMWLLNATTEKQRKGLADYFSPSIALSRSSGGGNGALGGDSLFTEETLAHSGQGANASFAMVQNKSRGSTGQAVTDASMGEDSIKYQAIKEILDGNTNEETVLDQTKQHIESRLTEDGLVLTLQDLENASLFDVYHQPTEHLEQVLALIATAVSHVDNRVALDTYLQARPIVLRDYNMWEGSWERGKFIRKELIARGVDATRFTRLTGFGDREPAFLDKMDARNNRINIILLHSE